MMFYDLLMFQIFKQAETTALQKVASQNLFFIKQQ